MDPTEKFLREVNQAFQDGNSDFLMKSVTENFCWTIVGEKTVGGKTEFAEALEQMKGNPQMTIHINNIIVKERDAIVEGIVIAKNRNDQKKYFGFCDIFKLTDGPKPKIAKMSSYVIDISKHKRYKESC